MKTILQIGKYYPPEMGGTEVVTEQISRALAKLGHWVNVLCFTKGSSLIETSSHTRVFRYPVLFSLKGQPVSLGYIFSGIALVRTADVIHVHAQNFLACLILFFRKREASVVLHWHMDVINKGFLGHCVRPLVFYLLNCADSVLVTSHCYLEGSQFLVKYKDRCFVLPLGRDVNVSPGSLPDDIVDFVRGRRVVLSVGRLSEYKGFEYLINAAQLLDEQSCILIVGRGELFSKLNNLILTLGLFDRVKIISGVTDSQLSLLYASAHLFCLPSIYKSEAFGIVLLEAMAYSLPIVATDIDGSGVPWVNKQDVTGINVPVRNHVALADAINRIVSDSTLRDFYSLGSRKRYEDFFTEKAFFDRLTIFYSRFL